MVKAELPLALPSTMAGVNQVAMPESLHGNACCLLELVAWASSWRMPWPERKVGIALFTMGIDRVIQK